MSAKQVLQLAVDQQLIEPKAADQLRQQLSQAKNPITAEALVKFLIDKQLITPTQGKRLLAAAAPKPAPPPPPANGDDDDIVDLEAVTPTAAAETGAEAQPPKRPPAQQPLDLAPLDDLEPLDDLTPVSVPAAKDEFLDLEPLEPIAAAPAPVRKPPPKPAAPRPQEEVLDLEPFDAPPPPKPAPKPAAPKPPPPKNVDLLDLEPLDAPAPAAPKPAARPPAPKPPPEDVLDLDPLEPVSAPAPKPAPKPPAPKSPPPKPQSRPQPAAPAPPPVDLFADSLGPAGGDLLAPLSPDPFGGPADPFGGAPAGGALDAPKPEKKAPSKRKGPVNHWDSPLLWVGGTALGLLSIALVLLLLTLTRGNAAEIFQKAEELYKDGSYSASKEAFEKFGKTFPSDPNAPLARIRRDMSELRMATDGADARTGLKRAQEMLPTMESLPKFDAARPELATILPDIADKLATQAKATVDTQKRQELATLVEESLALVNNPSYIPSTLRSDQQNKIDGIQEKLVAAKRSIDQDKELAVTVGEMKAAVDAGKPLDAYRLRSEILARFPGLEPHPRLVEVTKAVATKERDLVVPVAKEVAVLTDDPQADRVQKIPAIPEGGGTAPVEANQVAAILIKGAVYGIAVKTGRPLWRRHLGVETVFHPIRVDKQPAADILVANAKEKELLRLAAATGKVKWRLPVGEAFFGPVLAGEKIFITTASGEVWEIDVEGGGSTRRTKLPQSANVAPAIGARNTMLYQPGGESTLFALGVVDLSCRDAVYMAHRKGTTIVPPLAALGQIFVVENGGDFSLLHTFSADAEGVNLTRVVEPFRLRGRIVTPGVAARNRVVFTTELGEFIVLEVDITNKTQPLAVVGRGVATERSAVAPYVLTDGEQLWSASRRLDKYEIQGSLQQTARKWSMFAGETFVAPLQLFGETLVHTRQRGGGDAVVVEAAKAADGAKIWQLELGSPMAGLYAPDKERVVAVSRAGRKFDWTFDERGGGDLAANAATEPTLYVGRGTLLGDDVALFQSQRPGRLLAQSLKGGSAAPRLSPLEATFTSTWQRPAEFASNVLVPNSDGAVGLVNPADGRDAVLPFLPSLTPNKPMHWHRPATVGADRKAFVVASDDGRLFRMDVKDKPRPHLNALLENKLADRIAAPLAAAGEALVAVVRREETDVVLIIDAATLKTVEELPQNGRVTWGPEECGDAVAIGISPGRMLCIDATKKVRWTLDAAAERPGPPTSVGKEWLTVAANGEILRLAADSGEIRGRVSAGEPLGPAVVVRGTRLIAAAADGTLLVLPFGSGT